MIGWLSDGLVCLGFSIYMPIIIIIIILMERVCMDVIKIKLSWSAAGAEESRISTEEPEVV